ncbi:MAG: hypothetical protein KF900_12530 [Bacteroidetes bacterium]|nr:hypothetical protein [Bacteroidota bacterium]
MKSKWLFSLFLPLCFSCNLNEGKETQVETDSLKQVNLDSCSDFYVEDEQTNNLFKNIFSNNYQSVISSTKKINISSEPITNAFDSTKIDTIVFVRMGDDFFKFYSRNGTKTLQEISLYSNTVRVLREVEIGMNYSTFLNGFFKKHFKEKLKEDINCIHITTLSEYDHLYFFFKEDKLSLIKYVSNVESYR